MKDGESFTTEIPFGLTLRSYYRFFRRRGRGRVESAIGALKCKARDRWIPPVRPF